MIEAILPEWVGVAESLGIPDDDAIDSVEALTLGGAVDSRRREFIAGRKCARQAMARIGMAPATIPRGLNREPVWPENAAGSITHTKGYCAAAVTDRGLAPSLGIDAEPDAILPAGVLKRVTTEAEREHLLQLPAGVRWDRLLFSAKESVYKALWPLVREWIGFSDAEIRFDAGGGRFSARVSAPVPVDLDGRFLAADGFVMTTVVLGANLASRVRKGVHTA